ncbi:MAG: hypothetical protein ACRDHF_00085 [Tepidiformaceae bacterium]
MASAQIQPGVRVQDGDRSRAARPDAGRLEVKLPAPTPYALLRHPDGRGTLHATGEPVFHPGQSSHTVISVVVDGVTFDRLTLRHTATNLRHVVKKGQALPGLGGLTFVRTVVIAELESRYRMVDGTPKSDPSVIALEGSRAIVEVEVIRRRAAPMELRSDYRALGDFSPVRDPIETLSLIPVERIGPTMYAVREGYWLALQWATSQIPTTIRPVFFLEGGPGVSVASPMAAGVLNAQGFAVTDPRLVGRLGLEAGDVIRRVNGQPIDGMAGPVQLMSQARSGRPSTVVVEVERRGRPVTLTYRLK